MRTRRSGGIRWLAGLICAAGLLLLAHRALADIPLPGGDTDLPGDADSGEAIATPTPPPPASPSIAASPGPWISFGGNFWSPQFTSTATAAVNAYHGFVELHPWGAWWGVGAEGDLFTQGATFSPDLATYQVEPYAQVSFARLGFRYHRDGVLSDGMLMGGVSAAFFPLDPLGVSVTLEGGPVLTGVDAGSGSVDVSADFDVDLSPLILFLGWRYQALGDWTTLPGIGALGPYAGARMSF